MTLPIYSIKDRFIRAVELGPVIVTAATGSGKSTEIPRWCPKPVIVVEPRRIACRALATRVAELETTTVGQRVGYVVRDDVRVSTQTDIVFATPGVVLRKLNHYLKSSATFVLDEIHERTLELDLLLALTRSRSRRLVLMSATVNADQITQELGGQRLHAEGRAFPVDITYDTHSSTVPTTERLAGRVVNVIRSLEPLEGDVLVFLPGKAEIRQVKQTLPSHIRALELHGTLTPEAQSKIFKSSPPKVILSTNVAETSVTVPNVRVVVDSGLVRQVRYVQGRGTLSLRAIARDSADQRAGRAGRLMAGQCIRLWRPHAHLDAHTLPEIRRMSLVPIVLAARACGADPTKLRWLDAPAEHALQTATEELQALGALTQTGSITERGRSLFQLPVDPWLGQVLIEAEKRSLLEPIIDLVSALSPRRSLFATVPTREDDPRSHGCDLIAAIDALRGLGGPSVDVHALSEAMLHRSRLRRLYRLPDVPPQAISTKDRKRLIETILLADSRAARIGRRRGRNQAWGGHGTELSLDRRSAVAIAQQQEPHGNWPDAIVVLALRSQQDGTRTSLIATAAAPITLEELNSLKLGAVKLGQVDLVDGKIKTQLERVLAGKVLGTEQITPTGEILRTAIVSLMKQNRIFKGIFKEAEQQLENHKLAKRLLNAQLIKAYPGDEDLPLSTADTITFLTQRLKQLGLESDEDRQLVDREDLLPQSLPIHLSEALDRDYPRRVDLGEAQYTVQYDLGARRANLMLESGQRKSPPPRSYLPRFPGFKVSIQAGGTLIDLS
ncbi:MAG: DEAD/DEAH box helicase [Myxococcales bacterium]|nr:DEAD/DEAH box helicase [Myxococcales bacterium]